MASAAFLLFPREIASVFFGSRPFINDVLGRALDSALASMSTSLLAIASGVAYGIYMLLITHRREGWSGVRKSFIAEGLHAVIFGVSWWILLFSYHLFIKVPREIKQQALASYPPIALQPIPPSFALDRTPAPPRRIAQVATSLPLIPPMFSEVHDTFTVSAGSIRKTLVNGDSFCIIKLGDVCAIKAYVENRKFLVDAILFGDAVGKFAGDGTGYVTVQKNVLHNQIPEWDRCFNSTSMEVVDQNLVPMLQVIYTTPGAVLIYGLFRGSNDGYVLGFTHHGMHVYSPEQARDVPEGYKLERIFKYPSRRSHCDEMEASAQ